MPKGGTVHSGGYGRPAAENNTTTGYSTQQHAMFGSEAIGGYSDYTATMVRARARVADAAWNKFAAEREARQLRLNAKYRMAAAGREAKEIQYQGDVLESDAIAAMAASGTATDPVMLAKMKQRVDFNSLQAIFQGSREAYGMETQARATEGAAKLNYMRAKAQKDIDRWGATSAFAQKIGFGAAKAYGGG